MLDSFLVRFLFSFYRSSLVYLNSLCFVRKRLSLTIPFAIMENANPPLSPDEVASLRNQIESELRELRELNIELDHAFSDLAGALYASNDLEHDNLTSCGSLEEKKDEGLGDDFNLYPH